MRLFLQGENKVPPPFHHLSTNLKNLKENWHDISCSQGKLIGVVDTLRHSDVITSQI